MRMPTISKVAILLALGMTAGFIAPSEAASPLTTVYITKSGDKYHADGCRFLRKSKIAISLADARRQGYQPCSVCNP